MLSNPIKTIPIPLEESYLLKEGVKTDYDVNTYIFKYPKEWMTSDKGEMIIGVRTIWLDMRRRKVKYRIKIRKYYKYAYNKLKNEHPDWSDDEIYKNIPTDESAYVEFDCVHWLSIDEDLRGMWTRFCKIANYHFNKYNNEYPENPVKFDLYYDYDKQDAMEREVQWDGEYQQQHNCFVETIFSPRNNNPSDPFYVDIALDFKTEYDENGKLIRNDFIDILNIGDGQFENKPEQYKRFQRQFNFYNVWDRHSCKVSASFANDGKRNYVGNSQSLFNPIKYYKVNSTSDTFTISLYSSRHSDFPVKLSTNESIIIELQFMLHNKLLYI